jgi:hypothetical protein
VRHFKDALEIMLRIVSGLVPEQWRAVVLVIASMVGRAEWGDGDERWHDLARIVTELLREIEAAGALAGKDLILAARAAAEIRYTLQLRELGLLEVV